MFWEIALCAANGQLNRKLLFTKIFTEFKLKKFVDDKGNIKWKQKHVDRLKWLKDRQRLEALISFLIIARSFEESKIGIVRFIQSLESRNCFTGLADTIYKVTTCRVNERVLAENSQLH